MTDVSAQHPPAGWYPNADNQLQWWDGASWGPEAPAAGTSSPKAPSQPEPTQSLKQPPLRSETTAYLLLIFLGGTGAHRFYIGDIGWGIAFAVPTILNSVFASTGPMPVVGVLMLASLALWITDLVRLGKAVRKYNFEHYGRIQ